MPENEPGSDDQMTPEQRDRLAHQADLDRAAVVEEERKTAAQPTVRPPPQP